MGGFDCPTCLIVRHIDEPDGGPDQCWFCGTAVEPDERKFVAVPRPLLERILGRMEGDFLQIDGEWGSGHGDPGDIAEIAACRCLLKPPGH